MKNDFPIFKTHPDLVYLDSAATSQKPQVVIDSVTNFYKTKNSNIHRGIYHLAEEATQRYEETRDLVAQFINANSSREIVFTLNTNYAINLVSNGWAKKNLQKGDVIVLTEVEHHANIIPWLKLKEEVGVKLVFLPVNQEGRLDYKSFSLVIPSEVEESHTTQSAKVVQRNEIPPRASLGRDDKIIDPRKIKLLAITHASNVLGAINPIEKIAAYFRKLNSDIKILVDAAQSIPHLPVDVQQLNCDFLAFSSHKMLGPSGVGVLWAKEQLLAEMDPYLVGSHMIKKVTKDSATWADLPDQFEPGTGNLEGVVGLGAAIKYLQKIGMENILQHEQELTKYALEKLQTLPYLKLYGPKSTENRIGIFSFGISSVHPHDIAQILDSQNIAVRSGHHCCQVLMESLRVLATARASLYLYNDKADIDKLVEGIEIVKKTLRI